MSRKSWIVSVAVVVVTIVVCILIFPFPKKISMNFPAVCKNDGGYISQTNISLEGRYLDYLFKTDRVEGELTINAGGKAAFSIPIDQAVSEYKTEHTERILWVEGWHNDQDNRDYYTVQIYFDDEFEWIAVRDRRRGTFAAPAMNEADAAALVEYVRKNLGYLEW